MHCWLLLLTTLFSPFLLVFNRKSLLKLTCPVHIFNTEVSVIGDMTASYKYYYDVGEDKLCCKIKKLNTLKFFHPEDFMDEEDYEYETVHFSNLKRFIEFFEEKIEKYIKVSWWET